MRSHTRNPTESNPPADYVQRVNRAIDHVLQHLDQPLPLDVVARTACFSPFHFHRVFQALMGETLAHFVKRIRLDRALVLLGQTPRPSLTHIALRCGFGSSSDFSRSFKQRFGVPPSAFDIEVFRRDRRREWQAALSDDGARHRLDRLPTGTNPDDFVVALRSLPARHVAYLRVLDSYRPGAVVQAAERMLTWAEARGLAHNAWLGYAWDDPEIVAAADCRYDVGLEVDAETARHLPADEIGLFEFPAMRVAELEIRGAIDLEQRALDWLFRTWLPTSGFVPAEQPCFEAWIGRPFAHGLKHFELRVQVPVERA